MDQGELSEKEMWIALPNAEGVEKAKLLVSLSRLVHRRGSYYESLELAQASLKEYELVDCGQKDLLADAYLNLANAYRSVKNDPKAMEVMQKAVEIAKADNYPYLDDLLSSQANWYSQNGDWNAALNTNLEALRFNELNGCEEWTARSLFNVGLCYAELKMFEESVDAFRKSLEIFKHEKMIPDAGHAYCALAIYLVEFGNLEEALLLAGKALSIAEVTQSHSPLMWAHFARGKALAALGNYNEANTALSSAYRQVIDCKVEELDWVLIIKIHDEKEKMLRIQNQIVEAEEIKERIQVIKDIYLN
jgi:tetratricopeptide (TPR) repeat protein